ncbi:MAG: glycosyltransferase family 2 protein, partial [Gammaproteobacteria bacterium]
MKNTAPVSVIVPTFNRQSLLDRALRSVITQTLAPQEIIVIDDGSTDTTRAMMQTKYPHITYRFQENKGVSLARNTGISLAKSPWIAFLDSDDEWFPEKLH